MAGPEPGQEEEDEDCCPTCLEGYTKDNPRIWTRCGHHFHIQVRSGRSSQGCSNLQGLANGGAVVEAAPALTPCAPAISAKRTRLFFIVPALPWAPIATAHPPCSASTSGWSERRPARWCVGPWGQTVLPLVCRTPGATPGELVCHGRRRTDDACVFAWHPDSGLPLTVRCLPLPFRPYPLQCESPIDFDETC
jgi:hypothetical protein